MIDWIKKNKVVSMVLAILLAGFIANSYSSCSLSKAVKDGERAYRELRAEKESADKLANKEIVRLEKENRQIDADLAGATTEIDTLHANNAELRKEYDASVAQKYRRILSEARRAEIAENLIQGMGNEIEAQNRAISSLNKKVENLELKLSLVNGKLADETKLRLACEKQYKLLKIASGLKLSVFDRFDVGFFAGPAIGMDGQIQLVVGFGITFDI